MLHAIIRRLPKNVRKSLFVHYGLLTRAMTLGVRGIALNDQGHVLLVRHTYVAGWHLPGGGVERGETFQQAMGKEFEEEADVTPSGPLRLFGVYRNPATSRYDHVALFIADEWTGEGARPPNREIAETGFFSMDDLPEGTTEQTQQRLLEVFGGVPQREIW